MHMHMHMCMHMYFTALHGMKVEARLWVLHTV